MLYLRNHKVVERIKHELYTLFFIIKLFIPFRKKKIV